MKKNLLYLLLLTTTITFAQLECPTSIKTSGQSSPSTPIFTVPNGNNGCSASWPATINVSGSFGTLTYSFSSCNGGNLEYVLDPATQTPPPTFEMTIDFGEGTLCGYDANGNPTTLSINDGFKVNGISVYPNPVKYSDNLSIKFERPSDSQISIFNVLGEQTYKAKYSVAEMVTLNMDHLQNGIYFLRIEFENKVLTHKIIVSQ